jgi:nicotinamide-nucleotide amidase
LPELWDQIVDRFKRFNRQPTKNNRQQAFIPQGGIPVENPVGTAPAFIFETDKFAIISLPGVPREMEYLMQHEVIPYLRRRYPDSGTIKTRILHTAGVGESQIDDLISDMEMRQNPTVGLAAHSGQVDVRITAKAADEKIAAALIAETEGELRHRLGDWIYGVDNDTLEKSVLTHLQNKHMSLTVIEYGLSGELIGKLAEAGKPFLGGEILMNLPSPEELIQEADTCRLRKNAVLGLGVSLIPSQNKQEILIVLTSDQETNEISRPYGGPPVLAKRWAINHSLNFLRQI